MQGTAGADNSGAHYRIERELGRGGMGVVYEAWDLRLERRVALKVLHPHLTAAPEHLARLEREARLAARVEHAHVVRVYRLDWLDKQLAIEMQYVQGTPLHVLLRRNGALDADQACHLLRQSLAGLIACHAEGVIHCDLKPSNILITPQDHVYLSDFGVSRAAAEGTSLDSSVDRLWGTPRYSPPEAWEGTRPSAAWDLYSLGIVIIEACSGTPLFDAETPERLMRLKLDQPSPSAASLLPNLSAAFAALLDALVARDASMRPESAEAALEWLRQTPEYRFGEPTTCSFAALPKGDVPQAESPDSPGHSPRPSPPLPPADSPPAQRLRSRWPAWMLAGMLLLLAVAVLLRPHPEPNQASAPLPAEAVAAPAKTEPQPTAPPLDRQIQQLLVMPGLYSAEGNLNAEEQRMLDAAQGHANTGFAYFDYDDGIHGRELWQVELSFGNMRLVHDVNPGPASSRPHRFAQHRDRLYFAAMNPEYGEELWVAGPYDATARLVRDVLPGPGDSEPWPVGSCQGILLFYATTLQDGRELWATNGRGPQTNLLAQIAPGVDDSFPGHPHVLTDNEGAWFIAIGGEQYETSLWRFDLETQSVLQAVPLAYETAEFAPLEEGVLVAHADAAHGRELFLYRRKSGKLELLSDIWPGPESSAPTQLFQWQGRVFFQAHTPAQGRELWVTDGTAAGTRMIADAYPGGESSDPNRFTAGQEHLFYRAQEAQHGQELWGTDGTPEGTRLASDLRPGPESSVPYNIVTHLDYVFFTANDGVHGEELWMLDTAKPGAAPRLVADFRPGPANGEPHHLQWWTNERGVMLAKAEDGTDQIVLLRLEGSTVHLQPLEMPLARSAG